VLPGSTGGVASALITGKRGAITEEVKQAFRDSGLSHLLAIAGLHLGLVGAFVFFAVRGGLALIPPIALRYPIKKIAAGITLLVLACYLLLSGAAIPTQRAFVMNGLVFGAIIIDRLRISMRVCVARVVLVIEPASLVGVSFQMSFGAVVALIASTNHGARLGPPVAQPFDLRPILLLRQCRHHRRRNARHLSVSITAIHFLLPLASIAVPWRDVDIALGVVTAC
jgi:competence protein ComEC